MFFDSLFKLFTNPVFKSNVQLISFIYLIPFFILSFIHEFNKREIVNSNRRHRKIYMIFYGIAVLLVFLNAVMFIYDLYVNNLI